MMLSPERAFALDEIDAIRAGDGTLQRRGDKAAHQIGAGADIDGLHLHHGDIAARILPHVEVLPRRETRRGQ